MRAENHNMQRISLWYGEDVQVGFLWNVDGKELSLATPQVRVARSLYSPMLPVRGGAVPCCVHSVLSARPYHGTRHRRSQSWPVRETQ